MNEILNYLYYKYFNKIIKNKFKIMDYDYNVKLRRVASSSVGYKNPFPKLKLKSGNNNLFSKIINNIDFYRFKKIDKNIINNVYRIKPKTASRSVPHYNESSASLIQDTESVLSNKNNIKIKARPVWNYSYYYNEKNKNKNKNYYKLLKLNNSERKMRIKQLLHEKNPYMVEDWQKPRMIRILEKNSLIEEEIMLQPWRFLPIIEK